MNDDIEIFEKIESIIVWYNRLAKGFQDIQCLIDVRRKLATYSYNVAEITGNLKIDFDNAIFTRKNEFAKAKSKLMKEGFSGTEAEAKAEIQIEEIRRIESSLSGSYSKSKLLLSQINEILSTLNQHIAYLRSEKEAVNVSQN